MSSNSVLTSKAQGGLLIASWNLLFDVSMPKHAPQAQRLPAIAKSLTTISKNSTPDILFYCEGVTHTNVELLAKNTSLKIVGTSYSYLNHQAVMGFLAKPALAKNATTEYYEYGRATENYGFVILKTKVATYIGLHNDSRAIRGMRWRSFAAKTILRKVDPDKPTIIMGDFNTLFWARSRRAFSKRFHEVHASKRPSMPAPGYRGKTMPRFIPPFWSLDAIYISNHFKVIDYGSSYTTGSDHPLLFARLNPTK